MHFKRIFEREIVDPPIREVRKQTSYYPSAASLQYQDELTGTVETVGACLRAEYYQMSGEPTTELGSASGALKMAAGNILQPLVEHAFKQAGIWRASETRIFHPKMNISGRIDFWLVDSTQTDGGREVLVPCELKTTGKFQEAGCCFPKNGRMLPQIKHLLQSLCYLDYLSQYVPDPKLVLFYLGRDSMELGEHHLRLVGPGEFGMKPDDDGRYIIVQNQLGIFEFKHVTVRGVYKRYIALNRYRKAGEEPPPDYREQWDNKTMLAYAKAGAEYGKLNATDCKKVLELHKKDPSRVDDDSRPFLERGDFECRYCPWHTRCRSGIKHMPKPMFRQDGAVELPVAEAPVVEDSDTPI